MEKPDGKEIAPFAPGRWKVCVSSLSRDLRASFHSSPCESIRITSDLDHLRRRRPLSSFSLFPPFRATPQIAVGNTRRAACRKVASMCAFFDTKILPPLSRPLINNYFASPSAWRGKRSYASYPQTASFSLKLFRSPLRRLHKENTSDSLRCRINFARRSLFSRNMFRYLEFRTKNNIYAATRNNIRWLVLQSRYDLFRHSLAIFDRWCLRCADVEILYLKNYKILWDKVEVTLKKHIRVAKFFFSKFLSRKK